MNKKVRKYLLGLTILLRARTATAGIILNGSFESPALPNGANSGASDYWSGGHSIVSGGVGAGFWPSAQDGSQYAALGVSSPSTADLYLPLKQEFTVGMPGQYILSWYDNTAQNQWHTYSVSVTGNEDASFSGIGNATTWTSRSLPVTLSAGINTLSFTTSDIGWDNLIDNVQITAVPEPSSYLAGLSALGMLGLFGMRRNKSEQV